jgi:predicted MFS family arabinose efflux permease
LAGRPELSTAYSLESTLDEIVFVVGPLIASVLATQVSPVLVLYVAVVLTVVGVAWLASQRATEPAAHPPGAPRHRSALRERGMLLVVCAAAAMGAVFASAEITLVAFCGQHSERGLSGLVIACMAGGSAFAGLYYGTRSWKSGVVQRHLYQSLVFAVLPLLFLAVVNVGVAALIAFVVGLGIAPTLITTFGLVERLVPAPSLTEGLSWPLTGLNVGYGIGSALVGGIADAHGARVAFTVTIAAGVLTGVAALALNARLRASGPDRRTPVGSSEHAALS